MKTHQQNVVNTYLHYIQFIQIVYHKVTLIIKTESSNKKAKIIKLIAIEEAAEMPTVGSWINSVDCPLNEL